MDMENLDLKRFSGTKVLVVDDESQVRQTLRRFLGARDLVFVEASNAEEAIKKVVETEPELVFLDINLPDRNGLEILQEIQRIDSQIRIILISGWAGDVFSSKPLGFVGALDFLTKPFDFERLEKVLWANLESTCSEKTQQIN